MGLMIRTIFCSIIMLEEYIKQNDKLAFGTGSVNTLRIYSVIDNNGSVHILKAILRVGVGSSITDNYHTGGVLYPINIEGGFIESFGLRRNDKSKIFFHPGSGCLMLGYGMPYWHETIELVNEMAHLIPTLRYVGWDIAITEAGPELIEANHNADHALFGRVGIEKLFYNQIKNFI